MKNENNTVIDTILSDMAKIIGMDAIVNAANSSLLGGGRVDGTIHRATEKELPHECRLLGGCKIGQAKTTNAYSMGCRYIIYIMGPVWNGGMRGGQEKLSFCYQNSLLLALENRVKRIAFLSVSTGIYRFPVELAAETTIGTARELVAERPDEPEHVLWVLFDVRTKSVYDTVLRKL